jgi:hypothetical protein
MTLDQMTLERPDENATRAHATLTRQGLTAVFRHIPTIFESDSRPPWRRVFDPDLLTRPRGDAAARGVCVIAGAIVADRFARSSSAITSRGASRVYGL